MLRIGLIGCGYMGSMHVNCYKNIEGAEIVAFADIRQEKAEELAKGTSAKIYPDGKSLIENADVDAIDICLPTFLHCEYALLAMKKVKYLFVEKPVAFTEEEGEKMLRTAAETGCNVQIGQVIRFWDEYVKLKEIIDAKTYGKVINANFRRISPVPTWGWNDWLLDAKLSGGAAQDLHIHDIDYVLSIFGTPQRVSSIKNTLGEENSYINSLLGYKNFAVTVEGTWGLPETHPFEAAFRVVFEDGVVELDNGKFMLYTKERAEEISLDTVDLAGDVKGGNISDLGGYYNELLYFVTQAGSCKKIEKATLYDATASLAFVLKEIANA